MAAGEASVDICSLLGLEMVCVVPVGWPRDLGWRKLECWESYCGMEEDWVVLITSGKRGRRRGPSVQTSIRLGGRLWE